MLTDAKSSVYCHLACPGKPRKTTNELGMNKVKSTWRKKKSTVPYIWTSNCSAFSEEKQANKHASSAQRPSAPRDHVTVSVGGGLARQRQQRHVHGSIRPSQLRHARPNKVTNVPKQRWLFFFFFFCSESKRITALICFLFFFVIGSEQLYLCEVSLCFVTVVSADDSFSQVLLTFSASATNLSNEISNHRGQPSRGGGVK